MSKYHHVERRGAQWAVRAEGSARDARVFGTRDEAVAFARKLDGIDDDSVFHGLRVRRGLEHLPLRHTWAFDYCAGDRSAVFDAATLAPRVFCAIAMQGFADDIARFSDVVGIPETELARIWAGEETDSRTEQLLRDVSVVVSELLAIYEPEAVPEWLQGHAPGEPKTPMDWLREGNLAEVLNQINASATGAYS